MNPVNIIKQQVQAYNDRNIDLFVASHHSEVELYNHPESMPFATGKERIREIYGDVFRNSPQLNTEILNRMILGNTVIDHEKIRGRKGVDDFELIAHYEVKDGLIWRARFIRT